MLRGARRGDVDRILPGYVLRRVLECYGGVFLAGLGVALLADGAGEVFEALPLPAFSPPGGVLLAVWALCLTLCAEGVRRAADAPPDLPGSLRTGLSYLSAAFVFAGAWGVCFSSLSLVAAALLCLCAALLCLVLALRAFWKLSHAAALLISSCAAAGVYLLACTASALVFPP